MNLANPILTIVIPIYNEEESLPQLLEELIPFCQNKNWKIILVNDGSKDSTKEVLSKYPSYEILKILHHKVNKGYGGAIKTGIMHVDTKYCVTIDADGQHNLSDVENIFQAMINKDADMIVGNRKGNKNVKFYREFGKSIIRLIARMMMPLKIYDINSGMKMYDTKLAQKYIQLCPDSMAFSDTIALIFIYQRNLVLELPIKINYRIAGKSTIGIKTAFETIMEIINIVILFNPMRIFLPLSLSLIIISIIWEIPIFLQGDGISTGALLGFMTGLIFFLLGLIAEQLGNMRRSVIKNYFND